MVIRPHVVEALAAASTRSFTQRTMQHLRELFPDECGLESEESLETLTRFGIEYAGKYGIVSEDAVFLYVVVMVVLGREFDRDPAHAWATEMLANREMDQTDRMVWICDECGDRLDAEEAVT